MKEIAKIMAKNKNIIENIDISSLTKSKISYPTWNEFIRDKLGVDDVDINSFCKKSSTDKNSPIYTTIKGKDVKTPCGIDVPILLEPNDEPKGLIIILGESALRTNDDINKIKNSCPTKNTILGTPYALHLQQCPPKCAVYRIIFDSLLKEGYSLYITDIIKVWYKDKILKPDDSDIEIFKQELEFEKFKDKNTIIVAWGKKARNALHRMKEKEELDKDYLSLPHPGVNNWGSWKLRIFMKAVFNKNFKYATTLYGEGPIGNEIKTDEKIVAEEVVKSIKEHLESMEQKD